MSLDAALGGARLPAPTGDARSDRWREHRVAVRADLIEATLRAIDEYGPELSIDDVVKTAAIPRPKLYRFFEDKDTLFGAASERIQELIIERMIPFFVPAGTAMGLVRSALTAYIEMVDERPNLFRFLVGAHFSDNRSPAALIENGKPMADAVTAIASILIQTRGGNGDNLEYATDAILGAVALGVLRWLNSPTIGKEALIDEMTVLIWGALSASAQSRGVTLDPDEQLA